MTYYQTIITNQDVEDWESLIANLKDNGVLWVISEDTYKSGKVIPKTFELVEKLTDMGLKLRNIILWINRFDKIEAPIINTYKDILLFVKSENYFFDKDPIREKHIWKDIDWGKRQRTIIQKVKTQATCGY